jgi:hypothetical protein
MTSAPAHPVFQKPIAELTPDESKAILEIYKMLIDMADKVSQRRQNANNFYLSVNTALTGASAYLSTAAPTAQVNILIVSIAGFLVALLWKRNIDSYKDLNSGKFAVIDEIEKALPIAAFTAEWQFLERGRNSGKYRPFHTVERLVPFVFACVHLAQAVRTLPW